MRGYLPYIVGALIGALAAFLLSVFLRLDGIPQLILFGCLPALGGALFERFTQRASRNP